MRNTCADPYDFDSIRTNIVWLKWNCYKNVSFIIHTGRGTRETCIRVEVVLLVSATFVRSGPPWGYFVKIKSESDATGCAQ